MLLGQVIAELCDAGFDVEHRRAGGQASAGAAPVDIDDVVLDSRRAGNSMLFCAVPGAHVDGHDYAGAAVDAGAGALLVERWLDLDVDQLRTHDVRATMPHAAAIVHGHPSRSLQIVGVTGTNGKTTTTELLGSILRFGGRRVDTIGTLHGAHTTPEAPDLQRRLRQALEAGADAVAAEVSSHALHQSRVDGTTFAVAAFTNLTPDHLDYHGDMASYFAAKSRLFDGRAEHEIVNVDDPWGHKLAEERPQARRISTNQIQVIDAGLDGTTFRWRGQRTHISLPGAMNVANALMAAESALLLGLDEAAIATGLSTSSAVPGRMEQVPDPSGRRTVVVDYSHTPDSISRAIAALRSSAPGARLTIVFGCGGDRDRTKRPLMAAAAEAADRVVVTSDNPRSEDPGSIIDEAVAGLSRPGDAILEPDRRRAIELAIAGAPVGGVVLIAGKGHERTQSIGDRVLPFDDVAVAAEVLTEIAP